MRRAWILALTGLMLLTSAAEAQRRFRRFGGYAPSTPMQQRIAAAFSLERSEGMDDWAWRDALESQLTTLGREAVPSLAIEADRRKGYEADAARVSIFRIENQIDPGGALSAWIEKQHLLEAKVRRVMGLRDLLPHHLVYVVEFAPQPGTNARERRVVAVAADTKVQDLMDDATLARFLAIELEPARVDAMRENIAELACRIAAARRIDIYEVTSMEKDAQPRISSAMMKAGALSGRADVTFDDKGRVAAIRTGFTGGSGNVEHAPLPQPRPAPAMPGAE